MRGFLGLNGLFARPAKTRRGSKPRGPDGQPIDMDELFGPPQAAPTLAGVRSPWSDHPADGLTPARLASIHFAAAQGDPLAYLELSEDIEERDPHYAGVLGTRKRSVAQLAISVEAASDAAEHEAHADFIREWLDTDVLRLALFDMLDAIGKGFSVLEIQWSSTPKRVWPEALVYRPQRWFGLDRSDGETLLLRDGATLAPLAPHKFLVHKHPSKSGLTIRSGIARVAAWCWMLKAFSARDWAVYVQNYGQPLRLGRYGPEHSEQDKAALFSAIANIAGDCAAMIPRGMEIEFIEAKKTEGGGGDLYEKRVDWLDRQVSKLVLGQTTTTDAVSGGHAVSREHRKVQEDIETSDAQLASATLTHQLVPLIIALNFGPQERYPRLRIGRPDEVPLEQVVAAVEKLGPLGLTVETSWMRDRIGAPEPADGAEIIGTRGPSAAEGDGKAEPRRTELAALRHVITRHAAEPALLDRLVARTAEDAAAAMAGMEADILAVLDESRDLADAAARLARLKLDPDALSQVILRMMALSHLAGRAEVIEEIEP